MKTPEHDPEYDFDNMMRRPARAFLQVRLLAVKDETQRACTLGQYRSTKSRVRMIPCKSEGTFGFARVASF
jgi:hypothetical protein